MFSLLNLVIEFSNHAFFQLIAKFNQICWVFVAMYINYTKKTANKKCLPSKKGQSKI